ncbi:aldo/keto reductase [Chenggangzhangella methanolivorans]|uniref:Aldo/keto reductase n=1 Tax=Chenggangzhangella methanolivorans TaxID=1437009 RepID=A0A9E6RA15_9HYPH|nr:aldo/keto reductase [Chenggangzhangella methanolivorans]QZO00899.1 aldo/keto reductase [Chenggangzhangella methanolivorans]
MPLTTPTLSRRGVLSGAASLGAASAVLAAGPATSPAAAQTPAAGPAPVPAGDVISRAIPRSGEVLPAVGLGTFLTFDVVPGQKRGHLIEVVRRFRAAGGRVIDTSPLYGSGEITVGAALASIEGTDDVFVTNKIWSTGEYLADDSHARRSLDQSLGRLWREKIDVMQCHSLVNVDVVVPLMKAWKKEGRVRFVGASHHENAYQSVLAGWIGRGGLDFVQVNYSIANRAASVLKEAAAKGCGVLINMPFEKARLFKLVEGRPLPDFAADIGAKSWAAFFLKFVLGHPAVTCALPSTSNPDHLVENMEALRGPLPDEAMRARMIGHMESLPGFAELMSTPWYPGKRYPGLIARAQAELRARA